MAAAAPAASAAPPSSQAASQSQSTTKIKIASYRGVVYDIDAEGCTTWGDLKQELKEIGSESADQKIWDPTLGLWKVVNGVRAKEELKDNDRIEFGITVEMRPRPISVLVKDDGHTEMLVVDRGMSVKNLREFFAQKRGKGKSGAGSGGAAAGFGEVATPWTYEGKKLSDDTKLADLGLGLHAGSAEFHGKFRVTVTDKACELDDEVGASDNWTLEYLKGAYNDKRKRLVLPNASWTKGPGQRPDDDGETNPRADQKGEALDPEKSLFQMGIGEDTTVRFENPPFTLIFRESDTTLADNKAELYGSAKRPDDDTQLVKVAEVCDEWTVMKLKDHFNEHYAKTAPQFLTEDDRLVLRLKRGGEETELEPQKQLWRYVHLCDDGAEVLIKREQLASSAVRYICADCGEDVRLKKGDEVRCRQCGYRIVYKKRTTMPCQYLAR